MQQTPTGISIRDIIVFYGSWTLACLLMILVGHAVPLKWTTPVSYFFILFSLIFLSCLSRFYQSQIGQPLQNNSQLRVFLILLCILLFVTSYIATALFDFRENLLTAIHIANLLFFACLVGSWLAEPLRRPAELIPVCLVLTLVDTYSVSRGPSRSFANQLTDFYSNSQSGSPPIVDFLLVKLPFPQQSSFLPIFGITDWIMIVMLSTAAAKFCINDNLFRGARFLYLPITVLGLFIAILLAWGFEVYLPGLPLVAMSFFLFLMRKHPELYHLSKNELPAMIFCGALFSCLTLATIYY